MWIAAVRAEAEGSVRRGVMGPVVHYQPTRVDLERLRAAFCELARLHFEAGARYVLPGIHGVPDRVDYDELERLERAPLENRAYTWVLSHLFGGACAGADPLRSVVDEELCVRGVRGLHVACASVLPTNLGVNPQLCIMAVARLTAARLANQSAAL